MPSGKREEEKARRVKEYSVDYRPSSLLLKLHVQPRFCAGGQWRYYFYSKNVRGFSASLD
jgi:hypothetical protein